jgi:hypothetical protein
MHVLAIAHTPAAAIAAAGGGWVAMGSNEYEILAVHLARKMAGKQRARKSYGDLGCGDNRHASRVVNMARVRLLTPLLLLMIIMVVIVVMELAITVVQESAVLGVSEGGLTAFGRWHIVAAE